MTPPGSAEPTAPVGLEDVEAAARRIAAAAVHTPLLSLPPLDELIGARVRLKMESMQRAGAFKFRGAANAVALLPECTRGVVTFSSGNHAAALALAARLAGVPAVVVMPDDTQPAKVALAGRYGAEVVTYDRFGDDRDAIVATLVAQRRLTFVPPFDDPRIIAGQGTAALEMLAEDAEIDTLVVPVSGGGLIAGCGIVARASRKPVRVIGVEPEDADDFRRSLAAGQRVALPQSTTIADALRVATPGRVTFPIAQEVVDEIVTVSDDEVLTALRGVFEIGRLVIEPSAAVGIAALLAGRIVPRAGAVGVIVSGGNIAPHQFADLVAPREQPAGASAQHGEMSLRQVRT